MSRRVGRWAAALLAVAVLALAGHALWQDAHAVGMNGLRRAWRAIPATAIAFAALLTASSFAALAMLEAIACRSLQAPRVPLRDALRGGAIAHALCNTLGLHAVLAPALRLTLYRRDGLGAADVARLLAVVAGGIAAGVVGVVALALGGFAAGLAGGFAAAATIAMLLVLWRRLAAAACLHTTLERIVAAGPQAAPVGILESGLAMAALYVLLPDDTVASAPQFALAFSVAGVLGVVSHAPGGVGVFEASMLTALPGDRAQVLAALAAYRVVYNLVPAALAAVGLALGTLRRAPVSSRADTRGSRVAARSTASPVQ